jgi:hypothetical protein
MRKREALTLNPIDGRRAGNGTTFSAELEFSEALP